MLNQKKPIMAKSVEYMMHGRFCTFLKQQPALTEAVHEALSIYFVDCENARNKLLRRLDDIFQEFDVKNPLPEE